MNMPSQAPGPQAVASCGPGGRGFKSRRSPLKAGIVRRRHQPLRKRAQYLSLDVREIVKHMEEAAACQDEAADCRRRGHGAGPWPIFDEGHLVEEATAAACGELPTISRDFALAL